MRIWAKAIIVSVIAVVSLVSMVGCSGGSIACQRQETLGASAYNPSTFTYVRGKTWSDDYYSYYGGGYYQTAKNYEASCPVNKAKVQNYEGWVPGHWEQQG